MSKTRSVSNTLVFSSTVLSIVCFMALVQVEVEIHAHRKMLQILTHDKEGNVAPSQTGSNELIAFPPHGYSSKGECQFSYVWLLYEFPLKKDNMFTEFTKVKSRTEQHRKGKLLLQE